MPKPKEVAEILVRGLRYKNWQTVSVTRSGIDPFPKAVFTAASPIENSPNWSNTKLAIGDPAEVILGGRQAISKGRIIGRQPAYDATQHALQLSISTNATVIARATVDESKSEYKNYSLSQIVNALLKPYGATFSLKGETSGMEKPFPKVNLLFGETVYDAINRLCAFRNVYLQSDIDGNLVGYRLGNSVGAQAELAEGKNILQASASFNYTGALNEINVVGQRPGNDQYFGDDARTQTGTAKNPEVKQHAPLSIVAEMPGDAAEMRMRAQFQNGFLLSDQVQVQIVVQGWFRKDDKLWLESIGEPVSVYSPMLFTTDKLNLAIQEVTSTQGPTGTLTALTLVLPGAFNGGDQINSGGAGGGLPAGTYSNA